jgi:PAS domain S-box-containing protein
MTDDKQIHEALREYEGKFLNLFRENPLCLTLSNANDHRYIDVNQTFEQITGWTRDEVVGRTPFDIGLYLNPSERSEIVKQLLSGATIRNRKFPARMKNGELRTGFGSAVLIEINGETCVLVLIADVTDLKRGDEAEQVAEQLSRACRRLIQAHEEEHTSIVRELHKYIDCLALISIGLDRLAQNLSQSRPEVNLEIDRARQQVENLFGDIQTLSHRLRSPQLEYLGLAPAIFSFCRELSDQKKIRIDYASEGVPQELPKEISHALFYVSQEALQYAVAYSGSQHVQVVLKGGANQLDLSVRDWGIGFAPEEPLKGLGPGLTIMKERLKLVDGELSIESQPQRGTTIRARVPFYPKMNSAGKLINDKSR